MVLRWLRRYRLPILVFCALVLPLAIYRANAVQPSRANPLDKFILLLSSPLKRFMGGMIGVISDGWHQYVDVVGARRDNGALRRRLGQVEAERDRLLALGAENEHLQALLELKASNPDAHTLAATVIAAGRSPASRTLELNVGSIDGIQRGMPVLAGHGLVGLIERVAWTSSEVVLISDSRVALLCVVVRSRARGWVTGQGLWPDFTLNMAEVLRADDVREGDRVATSGLDGVFPGGIPVGEVVSVRTEEGVQHRLADIEPYVDFARLEHVLVLLETRDEGKFSFVTPEALRPPTLRSRRTRAADGSELSPAPADGEARDGGVKHRDAGVKPRDAGAKPRDAGVKPRDAGPTARLPGASPGSARG